MLERRLLQLILVLFVLVGTLYAVVTPAFEASDELWHYPMVHHLADGNPLPEQVFDPAAAGPWRQEASQPPLYYYLGAALTFWIDRSDFATARRLNPHVDTGRVTKDGNINLAIHDSDMSPWRGTLLAVRVVRLASVLLGAATVYLTYRIARLAAPGRPAVALGAAAVNAFMPMFLFISGSVNNDNLAIPLASLALLLISWATVRRVWRPRLWIALGIIIGLAILTKEGTLGLIPLAAGTALVASVQGMKPGADGGATDWLRGAMRRVPAAAANLTLVMLPVLLIAGWWYARNIRLYGDWLGWNAFIAVLGERPQPATLAQLWDERSGFMASYWGLFGGLNVPLPEWIYSVLNAVLLAGVAGFGIFGWKVAVAERQEWRSARAGGRSWPAVALDLVERRFAIVVCLLFAGAVIYGLINWATTTWSSQGRLVFTAISALTTLLALGLVGWLPTRLARIGSALVALLLFSTALIAPFAWIAPAYRPEEAQPAKELTPVNHVLGDKMRLAAYGVESDEDGTQPGESVDVFVRWEVIAPMTRDWSVFVHLNDPVLGVPLAQRDMYPGQGLLATSLLEPGQTLTDHYQLHIPDTALAPAQLELAVGLYDYSSGERLFSESAGADAVVLQRLDLEAVAGGIPNSLEVNFGHSLQLAGFDVKPRQLAPGEDIELTLYWRALVDLDINYTIFAQLLDERDNTRWAASDRSDFGGGTASWPAGEIQTAVVTLPLREDTPDGIYPLIVGVYSSDELGSLTRLQIVREGRITMEDVLQLTLIRVVGHDSE